MWKTVRQIVESVVILVVLLAIPFSVEKLSSTSYLNTTPEITTTSAQSSEVLGASIIELPKDNTKLTSFATNGAVTVIGILVLISTFAFIKYKIDKE